MELEQISKFQSFMTFAPISKLFRPLKMAENILTCFKHLGVYSFFFVLFKRCRRYYIDIYLFIYLHYFIMDNRNNTVLNRKIVLLIFVLPPLSSILPNKCIITQYENIDNQQYTTTYI